jgi:sugar-phosphatase
VAIVTSCTRSLLEARLAGSRLQRPREVVTFDDVEHGKPAPDPFLLGARRLGDDPGRCLAVEDAPAGLASARAAGCTTLAVGATHPHTELDADAHAPDLSHVRFTPGPDGVTVALR